MKSLLAVLVLVCAVLGVGTAVQYADTGLGGFDEGELKCLHDCLYSRCQGVEENCNVLCYQACKVRVTVQPKKY